MTREIHASALDIACVGDVMPGARVEELVDRHGVRKMAERVWAPVAGVDAIVANLEAPYKHVPDDGDRSRSFGDAALELFDRRFVLGLANNHIMDLGESGLRETLAALKDADLAFGGAGMTLDEAARPAVLEVHGRRLGVVAAADRRSRGARERSPGVFPARPELLRDAIEEAHRLADAVVVSVHAGIEYSPAASRSQLRMTDDCFDAGASFVVFHHAHNVGGVREDGGKAVIYGAGNYLFPPVYARLPRCWYHSVAWIARIDRDASAILERRAVLLDRDGVPALAMDDARADIEKHVDRWSRRTVSGARGALWRIAGVMQPGFLMMGVRGFGRLLRRHGPLGAARALRRSLRAHRSH